MTIRSLPLLFGSAVLVLFLGTACGGDDEDSGDVPPVECSGETPFDQDGTCVQCLDDSHCPAGQVCGEGSCACPAQTPHYDGVACHACLLNQHCDKGSGCDLSVNQCVEVDCLDEGEFVFEGACVQCVTNRHCPGELLCDQESHECVCPEENLKLHEGQCVECTKSTECPMGMYCKNYFCVDESRVSNCPSETPYNFMGECWECLEDEHCAGKGDDCHDELLYCIPPDLVCEEPTPYQYLGQCVSCLENEHCPPEQMCNKSGHVCEDKPVSPGECVYDGTGTTVGSQIGDFAALGCDGEPVNLHQYCGQAKAVWIILVAGWCGACDQYAPDANAQYEQLKEQGLQLIFVLGEDPNGNPPTPTYCQQWREAHSVTAPVFLDGHWGGIDGTVSPSGSSLPWDYLLDGDTMEFVWESVNYDPGELQSLIMDLLQD